MISEGMERLEENEAIPEKRRAYDSNCGRKREPGNRSWMPWSKGWSGTKTSTKKVWRAGYERGGESSAIPELLIEVLQEVLVALLLFTRITTILLAFQL